MTDTANAPERIQAWMQPNFSEIGSWSVTRYPEVTVEYVLATHCDELVAAAYLDARDSINEYPRVAPEADEANAYDEQIEHCQGIIDTRTPDNARAALTAYGERMKAEGAREAQVKIARLTEALDEKQDGGKDFWMNWAKKRLEGNRAMFLRDAKLALAGDMRALRNRVELMEAEPVPLVLSAALQENVNG